MTISDSSSDLSQLGADDRHQSRRGGAIVIALMAIVGLASCGEASAGVVPADTDHGVLASSPAATAGGAGATGDETQPAAPSETAHADAPAGASGGDVYVTGRTNLGGKASAEFAATIRSAVEDYVSNKLPGTTVVGVRVTTEQSSFTPAAVTLDGSGGARKVAMTLTEQSTGWVVSSVTPFPGGIR